jgi:hypothetical protein
MINPAFDPQRSLETDHRSDSQSRFEDARWQAIVRSLLRTLTHQSTTLVSFEDVRAYVGTAAPIARGTRIIPLAAIVGSVDRYRDFTREFLPRDESLRGRWERLDQATRRLEVIPPIDVTKVGEVYFVRDGNHRVSVARFNGAMSIEANVTELDLEVPLTPGMDVNAVILAAERADFLRRTHLDELRPDFDIQFGVPGRYQEVLEHIDVHRWYLGIERQAEVPYPEAVVGWYDQVYLPAVEAIHQSGLLKNFPKRTAADLYLWTMRHLAELKAAYSPAVDAQMAADDLARENTVDPLQRVTRAIQKVRAAWVGDDVPPIIEALLDKLAEQEHAADVEQHGASPEQS